MCPSSLGIRQPGVFLPGLAAAKPIVKITIISLLTNCYMEDIAITVPITEPREFNHLQRRRHQPVKFFDSNYCVLDSGARA
jgi:hypothetical protein